VDRSFAGALASAPVAQRDAMKEPNETYWYALYTTKWDRSTADDSKYSSVFGHRQSPFARSVHHTLENLDTRLP
jgi:hypothetical protein